MSIPIEVTMRLLELKKLPASNIVFPELGSGSLRDKVVACLKEAIFSGLLRPGDPVVERTLSQQMKIGTPAVREALVTLDEQGFLRRVANTATYVNSYSAEEVKELYQLRIEFELLALKWAKPRVTEADLQSLERVIVQMADAAVQKDLRRFYELDLQFHRDCWRLSGNRFLSKSLERLVPPLFAFVLVASDVTVSETIAYEHRAIVNALRRMEEPDFSAAVRQTLTSFAMTGIASMVNAKSSR
jgi:DNA-binding GntR family transcriptional regulator